MNRGWRGVYMKSALRWVVAAVIVWLLFRRRICICGFSRANDLIVGYLPESISAPWDL